MSTGVNGYPTRTTSRDDIAPAAKELTLHLGNQVTMKLLRIESGKVVRDMPASAPAGVDDQPQREVVVAKPFYIGVTEVTQAQYEAVMGKNPSWFQKDGASLPVEQVSWNDATEFCRRVSQKTGRNVRLPTALEWEYACRAGTSGPFASTGNLDDMGWYVRNSGNRTHRVASKQPNAWGLYDMHGNVWEWCSDVAKDKPAERVARGGGCGIDADGCTSSISTSASPTSPFQYFGFRVAADAP